MRVVGSVGLLFFVTFAVTAGWSLSKGYIPARWPAPKVYRAEHPAFYWFNIAAFAIGGAVSLAAAIEFLG